MQIAKIIIGLIGAGTISIGRVSTKNINTTAVTFGADRKDENNIMRGLAFRLGNDDVDVGNFGSAFDMSYEFNFL